MSNEKEWPIYLEARGKEENRPFFYLYIDESQKDLKFTDEEATFIRSVFSFSEIKASVAKSQEAFNAGALDGLCMTYNRTDLAIIRIDENENISYNWDSVNEKAQPKWAKEDGVG